MTYKTVMVGLAIGQPNDAQLEVAAQLAERFGARVIGVAAAEFSPPLYFTEGEPAQKNFGAPKGEIDFLDQFNTGDFRIQRGKLDLPTAQKLVSRLSSAVARGARKSR